MSRGVEASAQAGRKRIGFAVPNFLRGLNKGRLSAEVHELKPAASADHCGWLHKQGDTASTWSKRYFVLHGAQLAYYESEDAAVAPDESKCLGSGHVVSASRWPQRRPAVWLMIGHRVLREANVSGPKTL